MSARHKHAGPGNDPCTDPKHHVHDAAAYVHAVEQACDTRGLRLTPLRAQVLGLVAEAGKPIKAYDLLDSQAKALGFTPRAQTLEVHGTCADCAAGAPAEG